MPLFPLATSRDAGYPIKLGFIDKTGHLAIKQDYHWSSHSKFNRFGYCMVHADASKAVSVINQANDILLSLPDDHASPWMSGPDAHGIFPMRHLLDMDDPNAYESDFRERYYVGRTRHYGMNLAGEVVFEADFSPGADGFYQLNGPPVKGQKQHFGIINHAGEVIASPQFEWMIWSRTDPCISVIRNGLFGVIDYDGREILPICHPVKGFQHISEVKDGVVVYFDSRKDVCLSMTLKGEVLAEIPPTYWSPMFPKACPNLSDGLVQISVKDKKGDWVYYMDAQGNYPMRKSWNRPRTFSSDLRVGYFSDGLATYHAKGRMGYIAKSGDVAIEARFHAALNFTDGLAKVFLTQNDQRKDRYCYINTAGRIVARNFPEEPRAL